MKARVWIPVSNLYTFIYTEWGIFYIHATYCTVTLFGEISSPSDRQKPGITSPFLNHFQVKRWSKVGAQGAEHSHRPSHRYSTWRHGYWLVCETVVCLNTWCLEGGLWSCCFWQPGTVTARNSPEVLLYFSAQLTRLLQTFSCTLHLEYESQLSHILSVLLLSYSRYNLPTHWGATTG